MGATDAESPLPGTAVPTRRRRRSQLAASVAAVAVAAGIFAAVPELRHAVSLSIHGNFGGLRAYIRGLGVGGVGLLLALMLAHALIFYPTEIVTATAAYVFGFLPGLGFAIAGWLASGLLCYLLGRAIGRPALRAVLGLRFVNFERSMERGGTPLLLGARLIPIVPFSLVGYAAGASRVRLWRFAWTTVVGFLPLTAAVAYLGSRAQSLSASDPVVWLAALTLVVLLAASRFVVVARSNSQQRSD